MAKLNGSNLMESVLETQKSMVDKMVESTKKLSNGNTLVNETINKGTEWYNNWLENQKKAMTDTTEKAETMGASAQANANKMSEFFQNWQEQQTTAAKQMWDMNQNWFKNTADQAKGFDMSNPMAQFNNWNTQMTNMMNAMNNQNLMTQFQNWSKGLMNQNPFSMDSFKSSTDNMTNMFNQFSEMMNYNFASLQKSMQAGTPQDAFRNMMNVNEGFVRFSEMWSPMMSSIQNKTFNMDAFKKMAEPAMYKELMDKMFGFMPEHTSQYIQNFSKMMQDNMKQMGGFGNYNQMKSMIGDMIPAFDQNEMMEKMLGGYNNMKNSMNSIFAPMGKMMGQNEMTKNMAEWAEIADKMMVYNIKNAEMQYMIYEKGTKVMDKIAESIIHKQENGEEVGNVMALYQEWLNLSDAEFVALFESDEYSKIMAEVASMKMKLSKEIDHKMEQSLRNVPVATRSEMEEMHKAIYDLKKQVRQLEKMLEMEVAEPEVETVAPKTTAKKTATKK
jgi:polyhydroxyalkanoate synthase subunit PhaE